MLGLRTAPVARLAGLLAVMILAAQIVAQDPAAFEECSVGVACGRATADGRPLLWKNRDASSRDNVVRYFTDGDIPYVALCNAGSTKSAWGGANRAGFCIMNSVSRDLAGGSDDGPGNGGFMKRALMECRSVDDFEALLERTADGQRQTRANFGVIDATGGAAFFETGHRHHVRFDADETVSGILVRTNFATTADGDRGRERFARATAICRALPEARGGSGGLTHGFLLDEFLRDLTPPPSAVPGAPGRQDVRETIHRQTTVASMVFHGAATGEDALRTTMWAIVGQPLFSVAVPTWPAAAGVSPLLAGDPTSPICDAARALAAGFYESPAVEEGDDARDDEVAGDIRWLRTDGLDRVRAALGAMERRIRRTTKTRLDAWFGSDAPPTPVEMRALHERQARRALTAIRAVHDNSRTSARALPATVGGR